MLDNTDFQNTDIPFEVPLPEKQHVSVSSAGLVSRYQMQSFKFYIFKDNKIGISSIL